MNVCRLIIKKIYMTKRILVTGKNGQLGRSLQKVTRNPSNFFKIKSEHFDCSEEFITSEWDFNFVSRDELDLSNSESINEFFKLHQFAGIINCAAYTSVDKAESEVELAEQINHFAVGQLAEIAKKQAIPLIHISTDYVFPGKGLKPYNETDETEPLNIYGVTKLKGEQVLTASGCTGAIIRTSWLYSEFGKNFVKTMLGLAKDQNSISVVIDQVGSPTYATNLAKVILTMLSKQRTIKILNSQLNIYNFSDEGICSWHDFAKAIIQLSDISCEVNPVETKDYPSRAIRPHFNVMNKDKIKHHLPDLKIPYWQESLTKCLANLKKKNFY